MVWFLAKQASQTVWEMVCFLSFLLKSSPSPPHHARAHTIGHGNVLTLLRKRQGKMWLVLVDTCFPVSDGNAAVLNYCRKESLLKRDGEVKMWIKVEAFCKRKCKPFWVKKKKIQLHFLAAFCCISNCWKGRQASGWFYLHTRGTNLF